MRLQSIKFVLPTGCWPKGNKSNGGGGLSPLSLWRGLMVLSFCSTSCNGFTATTWLSSFLIWAWDWMWQSSCFLMYKIKVIYNDCIERSRSKSFSSRDSLFIKPQGNIFGLPKRVRSYNIVTHCTSFLDLPMNMVINELGIKIIIYVP
jgi:hypothetical protein